jgi:hypothetical protein
MMRSRSLRALAFGLGTALALASGCSRAVYTELDIVVDAEGQRHEIKNYGRCTIFDRVFSILTVRRFAYTPDGSTPALRLPSGAGILFHTTGALDLFDPCSRQNELLTSPRIISRESGAQRGGSVRDRWSSLAEGEVVALDLRRVFTTEHLTRFVVWVDDVEDPTTVVGYVGDRLFDDPTAKVQVVGATVRRMTSQGWGDREPTRIEDIIPWEAKYCPRGEHKQSPDSHREWEAPVLKLVPYAGVPNDDWKGAFTANLKTGIRPVPIVDFEKISAAAFDGPVYSFSAADNAAFQFNTEQLPPSNTLIFSPVNPSAPPFSVPPHVVDNIILPRLNAGTYFPLYYDASHRQFLRIIKAARFNPYPCSFLGKETRS